MKVVSRHAPRHVSFLRRPNRVRLEDSRSHSLGAHLGRGSCGACSGAFPNRLSGSFTSSASETGGSLKRQSSALAHIGGRQAERRCPARTKSSRIACARRDTRAHSARPRHTFLLPELSTHQASSPLAFHLVASFYFAFTLVCSGWGSSLCCLPFLLFAQLVNTYLGTFTIRPPSAIVSTRPQLIFCAFFGDILSSDEPASDYLLRN